MFKEPIPQPGLETEEYLPMVTVVVPMRNEERFIGECLDSLIQQDYPSHRMEVLVVDGGSEDASRSVVLEKSREHDFIKLLDNQKHIVPTALNIGIRNAVGDIIIRLDAQLIC